ncbi:MFS transporter [Paenibacillus sp. 1011MAR3C5]|uniref:MFS transporter n=1 Tax=Paenibacillus sp. 1011MAR3C5 TaxID=1675787 RepID=UPI000E6CF34F|nr:MFS transporter [Paenibacillus sp. 1011MAR3C5]RJE89729.1 MFS transporter [Paenibacillus sp. 1011MAR3C5]
MQQDSQQEPLWTKSFLSITVCSFLLFLNLQMLLSSFPAYVQNDLHAGNVAVSLVTSVFALTAIAARFMTAALMKRMSKDYLLMAGLLLAAVTTLLYPVAHTVGSLLIMRIGYGVGFGMASTILPTLVSQLIPARRMGEGIGYFGLSTSLAMSIGPMIGMNMMSGFGFGTLASVGTAVVLLILPILIVSRIVRIKGNARPISMTAAAVSRAADETGFNHKLWLPALLNVMLSITYSGLLSFIVLFGEFAGLKQVGMFFLFNAITIVIIRPISGRLFDRNGPAAVLIPAGLSVAASMLLLSYTHTMSMLIAAALLYGLGFGAIQPTLQAWMLRTSSKEQYGAANSMFYNSTDFGVAVGALLLGAIASMTDYASMYRYSAGVMVLFVILFLIIYASTGTSKLRNNGITE